MKFVELKKHLQSNNIYHCYNIFGDDSFLIDSSKNMFYKYSNINNEFDKIMLSAENFNPSNILSMLNTPSFFGGNKVVVLSGVDKQKNKDVLKLVEDYSKCPNPQTIFLIVSNEQLFDEKKFADKKQYICYVDCGRLEKNFLIAWINKSLAEKSATMTDTAKQLLIDYTNQYLSRISIELDKLIAYSNGNIVDDDVKNIVEKSLEYSIYELTENLANGNSEKSLILLNQMMQDKKNSPFVLSLIQNHFRRMFFSAISTKTTAQIATELGVKEFAIKKAKQSANLFSKIDLKNIVSLCDELDYNIKSGQTNYQNAVYFLVMSILNLNKNSKK